VEFTQASTARLPFKNAQNGRQVGVSFWLSSADPACAISSAPGERQPITTQIHNCRSTKFTLDLITGSANLTEVNKIAALIGHRTCAAWI